MTNQVQAQTAAQQRIGETIAGRFRVDELLRDGAMGTVYRATQLSVDRTVALKVVDRRQISGEGNIERFMREARIISELTHPNIVRLYDFGQDEEQDLLFLVMEFIEGPNLDVLLEQGRLSQEMALELIHQACGALSEPHANGVIHRDLKPENILLVPMADGSVQLKVVDFGVARALETDKRVTANGIICGTPWYMAPEQAKQQGDIDARADLYALGVILYQMLCGCVPFDADTAIQVILKQLQATPEPLDQFIPEGELAEGVEALVLALMAKAPADRPTDVLAARRMIEDIQDEHRFRRVRVETTGEMSTRFDRWIKDVSEHTIDTLVAESNLEDDDEEELAEDPEAQEEVPSTPAVDDASQPTAMDGWGQLLDDVSDDDDEEELLLEEEPETTIPIKDAPADGSIEIFDPEEEPTPATAAGTNKTQVSDAQADEPARKPTLVFAAIPRPGDSSAKEQGEEKEPSPFTKRQTTNPMHRVIPSSEQQPSPEPEEEPAPAASEEDPNRQTLVMFDENVAQQLSEARAATKAQGQAPSRAPRDPEPATAEDEEPRRKTLMMGAVSRDPAAGAADEEDQGDDPKSTQVFGAFIARDLAAARAATREEPAKEEPTREAAPSNPARVTAPVSAGISGSSVTQGKRSGVSQTTNTERLPLPARGPSIQLSEEVKQDLPAPTPRVVPDTAVRPGVTAPDPFDDDELYAPQRSKMTYAVPLLLLALVLLGGGVVMATGMLDDDASTPEVDASSVSAAAGEASSTKEAPPGEETAPPAEDAQPDVADKPPVADKANEADKEPEEAEAKEAPTKPAARKPEAKKKVAKKKKPAKKTSTTTRPKKEKTSNDTAAPPKKLGGSSSKKKPSGDVDDKLKKNLDWLKNR